MAMRTVILKLHKPGKRKQRIVDEAMMNYTLAYQYLLDLARDSMEEIRYRFKGQKGSYSSKSIEKWVSGDISRELNRFGVECFKDSLKMDFSMTIASYLQMCDMRGEVSYPVAYIPKEKWEKEYPKLTDEFTDGLIGTREYEKKVLKLNEKTEALKPIFFCRHAVNRDFCLLYDRDNNRYFAKLYLMNVKNPQRAIINGNKDRVLEHMQKDKEILETGGRRERFLIFPLSFGQWQEQYLKEALNNPGMIKTARLGKKNREYYLSINIETREEKSVKTTCFMGVGRGIRHAVNFTVADSEGDIITGGAMNIARGADGKAVEDAELHKLANNIVDIALTNRAQVITQPFINMGDRLQLVDEYGVLHTPVLSCNSYNRLNNILRYKLEGKGLPKPIETSPVGIFQTCPVCGLNSSQNRFSKDTLICIACGSAMEIETLGGLNLAKRLIKYNNTAIEIKVEKEQEGIRFVNEDLGLDYRLTDPMSFLDEFKVEVHRLIQDFYAHINERAKDKNFKKLFSMIKRIENAEDFTKLIKVIE